MKPASPQTFRNTPPRFQMNVLRLLFALLLLAGPALRAQENLIGTVGLAHTDPNGRQWAYITWLGNDGGGIANEAFAVYGKPGDASSASNYTRFSIVARQQDTHVIQSLLQRGVSLGDNLIVLDSDLGKLFGDVIPAGTVSLSEKLSAVLRGTTGNDRAYRNLGLLGRIHPGAALNLGIAAAEQFPAGVSNMTFEVRRWDLATSSDRAVVGRVTVEAGVRLKLPAPGPAVELPDTTASGNLNVKLRWGVPDALRRLGLATHGFNVWRVNKAYAEAAGWQSIPPTADQLLGGSGLSPAQVRRINTVPVLAAHYFTLAEAANVSTNGDPRTFFFTDNNDAFKGAQAFADGAGYYYFVTARDLLGRDGIPSPGTLLRACDRIPPQPPRNLKVRSLHSYAAGNADDGLLLSWNPPIGGGPGLAYHVYRYGSLAELKANAGSVVSNHIAGPLVFPFGTDPMRYIDHPCSNSFNTVSNLTYWYTVRAAEMTACGTNVSNPSGPGWGVCREWSGPGAINGFLYTTCLVPTLVCHTNGLAPNPNPNPNCCPYRLICYRESSAIEWAEFSYQQNGMPMTNRVYFTAKGNAVTLDLCLGAGQPQQIRCCVGTSGGAVACAGPCAVVDCNPQQTTVITFRAGVTVTRSLQSEDGGGDCTTHFQRLPYADPVTGQSGVGTNGIDIQLTLPAGTKEYRVYRSVDGGPRGLMASGTNTTNSVTVSDTALPVNSCVICYYSQALDANGNPGPLTALSPCVPVSGSLPAPQQSPITGASLSIFATRMNLSWFCPTPGVDHFEVLISEDADITSGLLTPVLEIAVPASIGSGAFGHRQIGAVASTEPVYKTYRTPRVGALFGSNDAFSVTATTAAGKTASVLVRAVDIHGNKGPLGNEEVFTGALQKTLPLPQVAWPARAVPLPVAHAYTPAVALRQIKDDNCFEGVGIVVGQTQLEQFNSCVDLLVSKPQTVTAIDELGNSVFPFVVYRQQVANVRFPLVTGDVLQVTPLIEKVYLDEQSPPSVNYWRMRDPFMMLRPNGVQQLSDIIVRDTQPVVGGARYRYTLVRFQANHEIEELFPVGEIEVTE